MVKGMAKGMMSTSLSILNGFTSRAFTTSNIRSLRFRSQRPQPELKQVGKFLPPSEKPYEREQCFIHKHYAYRGIVIRSTNCKVCTKRADDLQTIKTTMPFYQVLIDKDDWPQMNFSPEMTVLLKTNGNKEVIKGVDVVSHDEILPFKPSTTEQIDEESSGSPIKHDLYDQIFKKSNGDVKDKPVGRSSEDETRWFFPHVVHKQTTDPVELQVSTFNLGSALVKGHYLHYWRIVIRVRNTVTRTIDIKNVLLNVTSLSGEKALHDARHSACSLSPTKPVMQFNTLFQLTHPKGNHFWGKIQVEDDEGRKLEIAIPTIALENNASGVSEQTETIH